MTKPSSHLRLFVAVYPPAPVAEQLARVAAAVPLAGSNPVPQGQIHLTLQFIGDTPSREVERVMESVDRAAAGIGPFELATHSLVCLPTSGSVRVIAAETSRPGPLLELHKRLALRLAKPATKKRAGDDAEGFLPHVTLRRFASAGAERSGPWPMEEARFSVERLVLVRSTLSAHGAAHHEVGAVTLRA
jgi:2'-5' RNA ligase